MPDRGPTAGDGQSGSPGGAPLRRDEQLIGTETPPPTPAGQVGAPADKYCPQCGLTYEGGLNFCPRDGNILQARHGENDLVGQVLGKQYRILELLGEGGMGQVFLAEHVRIGRRCAIKVMRPALVRDPGAVGRFGREATTAGRINHPNAAAVYDFGETEDGLIYIVMEHVDGMPLSRLLASEGVLSPARAVDIGCQITEALTAAHRLGIIHRDLKPDNILVGTAPGGGDMVKVVDFGIAKAMNDGGQNLTRTGFVLGTLQYMSPEQLIGETLDGRSDLYSLGCILFEMLTGERTFAGPSGPAAVARRLTEQPPAPRSRNPSIPPALDAVVQRALARTADERYQSAEELRGALQASLREAPGVGAPATPPGGYAPGAGTGTADYGTAAAGAAHYGTVYTPPGATPPPGTATPTPPGQPLFARPAPRRSSWSRLFGRGTGQPAPPAPSAASPEPAPPAPADRPAMQQGYAVGVHDEPITPVLPWRLARHGAVLVACVLAGAGVVTLLSHRSSKPEQPAQLAPTEVAPTPSTPVSPPATRAGASAAGRTGRSPAGRPPAVGEPGPVAGAASAATPPAAANSGRDAASRAGEASPPAPAPARVATIRVAGDLPADALVLVDGQAIDGRQATVSPGHHTVTVVASGYEGSSWNGSLDAGENHTWTPQLKRPQPAARVPATAQAPEPPPPNSAAAPAGAYAAPASVPAEPAPNLAGGASAPQPAAASGDRTPAGVLPHVRSAASDLAAAISARDVSALQRAWPGITPELTRRWQTFLASPDNSAVKASVATVRPARVEGSVATGDFDIGVSFTNRASGHGSYTTRYIASFHWSDSGWQLVTIRAATP